MLIENATNGESQVQLVPYFGIVNPEHMNQTNCIPIINKDDYDDNENENLEKIFIEDFLRKSKRF